MIILKVMVKLEELLELTFLKDDILKPYISHHVFRSTILTNKLVNTSSDRKLHFDLI